MSRTGKRLSARLTCLARRINHPRALRTLAVACVLGSALATPIAARAANKSYPGANCVFQLKSTDWSLFGGGLFNRNPVNRDRARVDCPILRERFGSEIVSASIFVSDGSTQNVSCELVAIELPHGGNIGQRLGPTRHSSGSSSTPQQLDLSAFNPANFGTTWFIGCNLPSGSGILAYTVNQR